MKSVRIVVIRAQTYFPPETGISAYHATLFHGTAKRKGNDTENLEAAKWASLDLIYNLASKAAVIRPKSNLLVRQDVLAKTRLLSSSIKTLSVNIAKYVNLPFTKGDMSYFDRQHPDVGGDYPQLLRIERGVKVERDEELNFLELCAPLPPKDCQLKEVAVEFDHGVVKKIELAVPWIKEVKACWSGGCNVFEEIAAKDLVPHIDSDFFEMRSLEIT